MAGDVWRALARRMINNNWPVDDKKSSLLIRLEWQKNWLFLQFWEDTVGRRRQALAP